MTKSSWGEDPTAKKIRTSGITSTPYQWCLDGGPVFLSLALTLKQGPMQVFTCVHLKRCH